MNLIPLQRAGSSPPMTISDASPSSPSCLASDHLATMFRALPLLQENLSRLEAKFTACVFFNRAVG